MSPTCGFDGCLNPAGATKVGSEIACRLVETAICEQHLAWIHAGLIEKISLADGDRVVVRGQFPPRARPA